MRNTAEYEEYLTNPLEDRYPMQSEPVCDECSEPQDEQPWCGECGCCLDCCRGEYVGCPPKGMKCKSCGNDDDFIICYISVDRVWYKGTGEVVDSKSLFVDDTDSPPACGKCASKDIRR